MQTKPRTLRQHIEQKEAAQRAETMEAIKGAGWCAIGLALISLVIWGMVHVANQPQTTTVQDDTPWSNKDIDRETWEDIFRARNEYQLRQDRLDVRMQGDY